MGRLDLGTRSVRDCQSQRVYSVVSPKHGEDLRSQCDPLCRHFDFTFYTTTSNNNLGKKGNQINPYSLGLGVNKSEGDGIFTLQVSRCQTFGDKILGSSCSINFTFDKFFNS